MTKWLKVKYKNHCISCIERETNRRVQRVKSAVLQGCSAVLFSFLHIWGREAQEHQLGKISIKSFVTCYYVNHAPLPGVYMLEDIWGDCGVLKNWVVHGVWGRRRLALLLATAGQLTHQTHATAAASTPLLWAFLYKCKVCRIRSDQLKNFQIIIKLSQHYILTVLYLCSVWFQR